MPGINKIQSSMMQNYRNLSTGIKYGGAGSAMASKMISEAKSTEVEISSGSASLSQLRTSSTRLDAAQEIVGRLNALANQGASPLLNNADRLALGAEAEQLSKELDSVIGNAKFNGKSILQGETLDIQIDGLVSVKDADGSPIKAALDGFDLSSQSAAMDALGKIDAASAEIAKGQAIIGASQGAISRSIAIAENKSANILAAASAQQDVDIAKEVMSLKSNQVAHSAAVYSKKAQDSMQRNLLKFLQ